MQKINPFHQQAQSAEWLSPVPKRQTNIIMFVPQKIKAKL
jgi:hypothetical protein